MRSYFKINSLHEVFLFVCFVFCFSTEDTLIHQTRSKQGQLVLQSLRDALPPITKVCIENSSCLWKFIPNSLLNWKCSTLGYKSHVTGSQRPSCLMSAVDLFQVPCTLQRHPNQRSRSLVVQRPPRQRSVLVLVCLSGFPPSHYFWILRRLNCLASLQYNFKVLFYL